MVWQGGEVRIKGRIDEVGGGEVHRGSGERVEAVIQPEVAVGSEVVALTEVRDFVGGKEVQRFFWEYVVGRRWQLLGPDDKLLLVELILWPSGSMTLAGDLLFKLLVAWRSLGRHRHSWCLQLGLNGSRI